MKRYLYIILGLIAVAVVILLIVLFYKSGTPTTTTTGTTGTLPGVTTQNGTGGGTGQTGGNQQGGGAVGSNPINPSLVKSFNMVFAGPVLDYFVDGQNVITAVEPNGSVVSAQGNQSSSLSSSAINGIISASFSMDGKKILVSFGDPANPQASIFDVATKAWMALPQGLISPAWSSTGYQIAYLATNTGGGLKLSVLDIANVKKVTTLFTINVNDLTMQWVGKTQFLLADKPSSYFQGSAWIYDSLKGSLTSIAYEKAGLESIWGQQSSTSTIGLLYSNDVNGQGQTLSIINTTGTLLHSLTFTTLPTKCGFHTETSTITSSATTTTATTTITTSTPKTSTSTASSTYSYAVLYCGIPLSSDDLSSANLPDDYNQLAVFTNDEVSKLNSATGQIDVLWNDPSQHMDVSDVRYFNNAVFFVNRYDRKLYAITLLSPAQ